MPRQIFDPALIPNPADAEFPEDWEIIPGHPSYEVSSMGRVRCWSYMDKPRHRPRNLKLGSGKKLNYHQITLSKGARQKREWVYVQRLVVEAFLGPAPKEGMEINHKNGIGTDNRVENLEWVTHSENLLHAVRVGLKITKKGEDSHSSKITNLQALEIKQRIVNGEKPRHISKDLNISKSVIGNIRHGSSWKQIPWPEKSNAS